MFVMNFVSHRGMAFSLIGRSVVQQFCFFYVNLCVPVHSMTLKLCYLRNVSVMKNFLSNNVVELSCTIKIEVLTEEATA